MVNYQNGKIYRVVCNTTGLCYIGSTTLALSQRLAGHTKDYKVYINGKGPYISSFKVLENNNYEIVLIELCQCNTKEELHRRERFHIESTDCVNMIIPTRTHKEYREDNKEVIYEKNKQYRNDNREILNAKQKDYALNHKEEIKKYKKEYSIINKEKIQQKRSVILNCECGKKMTIWHKVRHEKSKFHINFMNNKNQDSIVSLSSIST